MKQKTVSSKPSAEKAVRDIRRKTRRLHSAEEKIRIVLSGLRGEESIAALCRRERGLVFSRESFLQDQLIQRQIGDRLSQTGVLLLQILEPPRLVGPETAVFLAPAVITLLGNAKRPADLSYRLALRQRYLCLTQKTDDLLRSVTSS